MMSPRWLNLYIIDYIIQCDAVIVCASKMSFFKVSFFKFLEISFLL